MKFKSDEQRRAAFANMQGGISSKKADFLADFENEVVLDKLEKKRLESSSIKKLISSGEISDSKMISEIKGKYNIFDEFRPLPKVLYHVTTNKSKVFKDGLKTRNEMNMKLGCGLGGGASDTISFTTDLNIAREIKRALLEARKVANGDIKLHDLVEQARSGIGAERPFLDDIWGKDADKDINHDLYWLLRGQERKYNLIRELPEKMKGWTPMGDSFNGRYNEFVRNLSEKELCDKTFDLYKRFSLFRESAGGYYDPLFFLTDVEGLAKTNPSDIEILEYRSKSNSKGVMQSALGEWRVFTSRAVDFVGVPK